MSAGRELGRSGVMVSPLTLGCAPLGNLFKAVPPRDAVETIATATAAGIFSFDVAPLYGNGLAERRLGVALVGAQGAAVSTKVGRRLTPLRGGSADRGIYVDLPPFSAEPDYSFDGTLRQVEESLQRLGRDMIDTLLIHDYTPRDNPQHNPVLFKAAMDGAHAALHRLKEQGVVRAIGFGVNHVDLALRFIADGAFDCAMLAGRYSLLDRSAKQMFLPICRERGIGVMLAAPFASGILAVKSRERASAHFRYDPPPQHILDRADRIEAICRRHGTDLKSAAIQFPMRHEAVTTVVVGCRSPKEVLDNVKAASSSIPEELWLELERE